MKNITTGALFFLAAGIFTSVTILSVYQILIAISCLIALYLMIKGRDLNLPTSAYWLLGFAIIALIGLVINFELIPKPSKNFGRLKYYLYAVLSIVVLKDWLLTASIKTKKIISNTFLISLCAAGITAIVQVYCLGKYRAEGLTGIMRYGYGSGMILPVLMSLLLHHKSLKEWFNVHLGAIAFALGLIGLYLTLTRGGLLGFVSAIPIAIYFYRPKWGIILGMLALLGITILGGFYLFGTGNYSSRFLVNKNVNSDVMRRSQWEAAWIATKERPFLGWGLSNFHTQLKRIKYENDLAEKDYNDSHAHNLFLEISSGTGLIGLFFFLGWLVTWIWEAFKSGPLHRAIVLPFTFSFIIVSQFEVTFDANNASMVFAIYSLMAAIALLNNRSNQHV